ncbi:CCHC-type domain-containing protein [Plasmodiophora brassicae]
MRWLTAFARITQTPLTSTSPLSDAVQCILTTALKGYALETYLDLSEDASMADVASALLHDFPEPSLKWVEADFDNLKQTSSVVHHAREFQRLYKKVQQLDPLYRLSPSRLAEKFRMSLHPALSDALFIYNYTEYDKMFEMAIHLEPKYPIAAVNAIEVGGAQPLVCHYCREAGHFIASCPKRPPCQHCHKVGHRSALCPERPAAAGPPSPPPSASVPQAGPPGNVPGRL